MKYVRRIVYCLLLTAAVNALPLVWLLYAKWSVPGAGWLFLLLAAAFLWVNLRPIPKAGPTKRIRRLAEGCELRDRHSHCPAPAPLAERTACRYCGK